PGGLSLFLLPPSDCCSSFCCPLECSCEWTDWIDVSYPNGSDRNSGDYETFENILIKNPNWVCAKVDNISCRAEKFPHIPIENLGQVVECSVDKGLICNNKDQPIGSVIPMPVCFNYEISVCCVPPHCLPSSPTTTPTQTPTSTTSSTTSSTTGTTSAVTGTPTGTPTLSTPPSVVTKTEGTETSQPPT
ncbi:MUC5B protein, partial [Turnix velox]|nr:MUC5B protein [Turnix velox]